MSDSTVERQADLIIRLATRFVELLRTLDPEFRRGFFRFKIENRMHESCASYDTPNDVFIIDALSHDDFFDDMDDISLDILSGIGTVPALLLLTVDQNFEYGIQFEYADMDRWHISLADGGTGRPS
jgi:hypothetical protein